MSFTFGALKKRLRVFVFFLNQNVSSPCNDKFPRSCPCWTSTKRKIQRGHKKVTEVTFNLKWLRVQEKQPFWLSMPDRFSSFEFGNLKHCCAKWHWGFPPSSVFCSLNLLLLSLHALHPFLPQGGVSACNRGKLLKIEEDASHGSLIMELPSWGGAKCLGHGATCILHSSHHLSYCSPFHLNTGSSELYIRQKEGRKFQKQTICQKIKVFSGNWEDSDDANERNKTDSLDTCKLFFTSQHTQKQNGVLLSVSFRFLL